jgi:hypothetical protein
VLHAAVRVRCRMLPNLRDVGVVHCGRPVVRDFLRRRPGIPDQAILPVGVKARQAARADVPRHTAGVVNEPSYDMTMLSERWAHVHGSHAAAPLEAELVREVAKGHCLSGLSVRAIAVRKLQKEVIFWLPAKHRWAWVHLTWTKDISPMYPRTEIVATWEEVVRVLRNAAR